MRSVAYVIMDREERELRSVPVLPPVIIEHIKKREMEERRRREQAPVIQLPLPARRPAPMPQRREEEESDRGVVVIDVL